MTDEHHHLPKDPQTQRTRWELRAIMIIVAVVLVASLAWRALGHHPAQPEKLSLPANHQSIMGRLPGSVPAAPAGVPARPPSAP